MLFIALFNTSPDVFYILRVVASFRVNKIVFVINFIVDVTRLFKFFNLIPLPTVGKNKRSFLKVLNFTHECGDTTTRNHNKKCFACFTANAPKNPLGRKYYSSFAMLSSISTIKPLPSIFSFHSSTSLRMHTS